MYFVVRLEKKDGISSCVLNVTGTQMGRYETSMFGTLCYCLHV